METLLSVGGLGGDDALRLLELRLRYLEEKFSKPVFHWDFGRFLRINRRSRPRYLEERQLDFVVQEATQIRSVDDDGLVSIEQTGEETVVSRARSFVAHVVARVDSESGAGELREIMPMLRRRAHETVALWHGQQRGLLKGIMKVTHDQATAKDRFAGLLKFGRTVVKSAMHTHPVVRCIFAPIAVGRGALRAPFSLGSQPFPPIKHIAPPQSPFGRADRVLHLFSMWLGGLTVIIWLSAERSVNCCLAAAEHVGCGLGGLVPSAAAPCATGGHSSCRELMVDSGLDDFFCDAFPVPGLFFHIFVTVLLIFAVVSGRSRPSPNP